jgi:hypothetical protein
MGERQVQVGAVFRTELAPQFVLLFSVFAQRRQDGMHIAGRLGWHQSARASGCGRVFANLQTYKPFSGIAAFAMAGTIVGGPRATDLFSEHGDAGRLAIVNEILGPSRIHFPSMWPGLAADHTTQWIPVRSKPVNGPSSGSVKDIEMC